MILTSEEGRSKNKGKGYIIGCNIAHACSIFSDLNGLLKNILEADFYYDRVVLYQVKTDELGIHRSYCKELKEKVVLCGQMALPSAHDRVHGTILFAIDIKKTREKHGVSMNPRDDDNEENEEQEIYLDEDDQ